MFRICLALCVLTGLLAGCDRGGDTAAEVVPPTDVAPEKPKKKAGSDGRYAALAPDDEIPVGAESTVALRIEPRGDLKINKEFPWSIEFEPAQGATLKASAFDKETIELTDSAATIPVALTPEKAGKATLRAVGNFSVCNPQRCDILRDEPLEFTVVAAQPTGDAATDTPEAPTDAVEADGDNAAEPTP